MNYTIVNNSGTLTSYRLEDGTAFTLSNRDLQRLPSLNIITPAGKIYLFDITNGTINESSVIGNGPLRMGISYTPPTEKDQINESTLPHTTEKGVWEAVSQNMKEQATKPGKVRGSMPKASFKYMTVDEIGTPSEKDRKENKINHVKKNIEKALQSEANYRDFLYDVGYPSQKIPAYESVQSIELEGDKLVINEFASDPES